MNKIIAIPLSQGLLSAHFGHCEAFAFVTVENNIVTNISSFDPPEHVPGSFPRWVASKGATDVIAGGMGPQAVNLFNAFNINVFVGAPVIEPKQLVELFLADKLNLSANYCDHDGDHEHHSGHNHSHGHHHHGE
jgi:predicted Fe-Mo cluster-binding NifX family protein